MREQLEIETAGLERFCFEMWQAFSTEFHVDTLLKYPACDSCHLMIYLTASADASNVHEDVEQTWVCPAPKKPLLARRDS